MRIKKAIMMSAAILAFAGTLALSEVNSGSELETLTLVKTAQARGEKDPAKVSRVKCVEFDGPNGSGVAITCSGEGRISCVCS